MREDQTAGGGRRDRPKIQPAVSTAGVHGEERTTRRRRTALLLSVASAVPLAGLLTIGVVGWEHAFHADHLGLAEAAGAQLTHALRDGVLAFPMGLTAVLATRLLVRLPCLRGRGRGGDLLLRAALLSLLFGALLIPSVGLHGVADRFFDPDGGADAGGLGGDPLETDTSAAGLALHGIRDALLGQVVALPLALLGLKLEDLVRARPWRRLSAITLGAHRLAMAGAGAVVAAALVPTSGAPLAATPVLAATDPCSQATTPARSYNVSAINVKIPYNRFGDNDPLGVMYVLDQNITAVRNEEASQQVSIGLREDVIQPLVIRGNLGDCVTINFTNRTTQGLDASGSATAAQSMSMHFNGVSYQIASSGSSVGFNPNSFAAPGQTVTYRVFLDPALGEGGKVFQDHGDSRQMVAHGAFGVLDAEPQGSTYLDPQTAQPLSTSNWEAIIQPPSGPSFREFNIIYHEVGDESFQLFNSSGGRLPLNDPFTDTYRPGTRALNYRSEPFFDRMQLMNNTFGSFDESQGYGSYMFGDPATPTPRSYLGEPTKSRLVHAGSEQGHVHHLHGGGDRWRQSPGADSGNDISGGLEKYPDQQAQSIRLDSQTVNPGESYTLEHECGAGGCQQVAGDFLYHCHIAHHYVAGMWSFWRVFDTLQPDLATIPGRTAAPTAVTSDQLLGRTVPTVNGNRTIVLQSQLTDPTTQVALESWVESQFPPQGTRIDSQDATVWNWLKSTTSTGLPLYEGEPEDTHVWPDFASPTPGQRPNILFDPNNGRYAWPLLQPHLGQRPPFSGNAHTGAPWLGETAAGTRNDGLCPSTSTVRNYNVTAISLAIKETAGGATDNNGQLFVLNEDKNAVLAGTKPAIPLAIRSNTASPTDSTKKGDCVALTLSSQLNPTTETGLPSKVNMHTHFVQFDPQASDGVITGRSYEQSVKPFSTENRTLTAAAAAGATTISVTNVSRLRTGVFIAVGQGQPTIEMRRITAINAATNVITLDTALSNSHPSGEPVGVEFVRYRWFSDVDSGTVFWHDHVDGIHSWGHGLFGAHIIEPFGSTYHDPRTGAEVRSGQIVDIWNTTAGSCVGVVALNQCGSFREFMLWLHDNLRGTGADVGAEYGSINLRANPFSDRGGDTDPYVFSSVKYGDPFTPLPRAYVGDQFVIRTIGLTERVGALRVTGHRFRVERFNGSAELVDSGTTGISERFDYVLDGGAGGPARKPGDYLYYSSRNFQLENGAWGVIRVHDKQQTDLEVLPGNTAPPTGQGFPQLKFNGNDPPVAQSPGNPCPSSAPMRKFSVTAFDTTLPLGGNSDSGGTIYALSSDEQAILNGQKPVVPLVIRANAGDCVQIQFINHSNQGGGHGRAGLSLGRLLFDPQGSYGAAIGLNPDSSVPRNGKTTYAFYADKELGTSIFLNLADVSTLLHGAYGAVVVEPQGSTVYDPTTGGQLPSGLQAVIEYPSGSGTAKFREFASLFHDTDAQIGRSIMPYDTQVSGFSSLNYQAAPLDKRLGVNSNPSLVFNSNVQGDPPTTLMRAYPGDPVRFRVATPAAENVHTFTVEGHSWPIQPFMQGAQELSNRLVMGGQAIDAFLTGGAGGTLAVPGDYLYGDHRMPYTRAGMWGIFRVFGTQQADLLPLSSLGTGTNTTSTSTAAPTNVTAAAGQAAATVKWTPPTSSNGPVQGYVIATYLGGTKLLVKVSYTTGTTTELSLGLSDGTSYAFQVAAVTPNGVGAFSSMSTLVTPRSVASAPGGVGATAGTGSATLTWSAPTSNGASPISGYTVTVWTNNSLTLVKQVAFPATATGGTVTGLTAGTTYTFTIAAVNGVGTGPGWPVTNAVTAT